MSELAVNVWSADVYYIYLRMKGNKKLNSNFVNNPKDSHWDTSIWIDIYTYNQTESKNIQIYMYWLASSFIFTYRKLVWLWKSSMAEQSKSSSNLMAVLSTRRAQFQIQPVSTFSLLRLSIPQASRGKFTLSKKWDIYSNMCSH